MLISIVLALGAVLLSVPACALLTLTLAAGRRPVAANVIASGLAPRLAVLVPAHNESRNVLPTIACLLPQMKLGDRLLVIADNCTDDTAELAAAGGATVLVRHNLELRGKGFALAFGIDALRADPPDVVAVVDADCTVSPDAIERIACRCQATAKPVQMLNLMHASTGAGVRLRILEFAMVMKNLVRPLGAYRLGGVCHLMGTGMALPWALMSTARLATGHIAEDMKLGIDMALQGHPSQFFLDAEISSMFPDDTSVARTQKSRWEHGHLALITEELPRLIMAALRLHRWTLFVLALDLLIPPMALYVLSLGTVAVAIGLTSLFSPVLAPAAAVLLVATAMVVLAVGLAWWRYGRHLLTAREILFTPLYAIWKLPVYVAYALRRRSGWVRTKRKSE